MRGHVDASRFDGKRVFLPGEISMRIDSWNGEVSRGHSSGAKPLIQWLTRLSVANGERVAVKG